MSSSNRDNNETKLENLFDDTKRRIRDNEQYTIVEMMKAVFHDIFVVYKNYIENKYEKPDDNLLLKLICKIYKSEDRKKLEESFLKNKTCDSIFIEYLEYLSKLCNKEYFLFAFKFIVLFRECINKYKNVELMNRKCILNEEIPDDVTEYTQQYNADQVPDLCNEFYTDFMENGNFFGLNTEEDRNEFIEIIQHFCYWLFKKSFTSSKLTLLT